MSGDKRPGIGAAVKRQWPLIRKVLLAIFVISIVVSIVLMAKDVEWSKVVQSLRAIKGVTLWAALGLVAASYFIYAIFDIVGRAYVKHDLPAWKVMLVGFISYAFNLSLGSFVGGVGFRYRLYTRLGLSNGAVTRILGLSLVTNWIGYFWLAGAAFASGLVRMPKGWEIGSDALRWIGIGLLAVALVYVVLCAVLKRKAWKMRGHEIELPSFTIAVVQSVLAALSWAVIGAIIWVLFDEKVPYVSVLGVLLLSSIAGAVAHIPGGVGVIEAVFVAMLAGRVPRDEIIGALVAYRALYYLLPLAVAGVIYLIWEGVLKKSETKLAAS